MAIYSDLNYIKPSLGDRVFDVNAVYQSVFSILGTKVGERVFRPTYGMSLKTYLFEPCDEITARSILYEVTNIMDLEPRVSLNLSKSTVKPVPNDKMFVITLVFSVLGFTATEKTLNLVLK